MLGTALLGLAGVVLLLVLGLSSRVAGDTGDGAAHRSRDAVRDSRAEVRELALGLLLLALEVLVAALALQGLLSMVSVLCNSEVGGWVSELIAVKLTSDPIRLPTVSFAEPTVWL